MKKLLIIGASGHGRVIADIATRIKKWQEIVFLDDDVNIKSSLGLPVVGMSNQALNFIEEYEVFIAIGNNEIREMLQRKMKATGATIPILIHPSAVIGAQVELGMGTAIMAGAVINCGCRIGEGCIINTGATVDHDCTIEDYVHISPGTHIAGTVTIGKHTWVGVGVAISNNIKVAQETTIGAGTVVIKNICEPGIYVGNPARMIRTSKV